MRKRTYKFRCESCGKRHEYKSFPDKGDTIRQKNQIQNACLALENLRKDVLDLLLKAPPSWGWHEIHEFIADEANEQRTMRHDQYEKETRKGYNKVLLTICEFPVPSFTGRRRR